MFHCLICTTSVAEQQILNDLMAVVNAKETGWVVCLIQRCLLCVFACVLNKTKQL